VCAALAAFARPFEDRGRRAAAAATLAEYLTLRAQPTRSEVDPLRALLAADPVTERAANLLFAPLVDDTLRLDDRAGILPRALDATFAAPDGPVVLLGCDEAGLAPGFDAALATACALPVLSGAARGQSPLGHIGLFERARRQRVAAFVSVWNLANDLGETELLRRVQTRLGPGGPIDALLASLRDPARAAAAQEAWFVERDDAAEAVIAVLAGAGFELERRARLHGAGAVVVLLGLDAPDHQDKARPRTARMAEALERALRERGVRVFVLAAAEGQRDAEGRLTAHGVEAVVAGVGQALE
jgi:hypothetical protein